MEDKKGDLQSNGVLKQNLLLQTSKKINRNLNKKITNQRGINPFTGSCSFCPISLLK